MTGAGVWAGMYVITAQHMLNYYQSGSFWNFSNTKYNGHERYNYMISSIMEVISQVNLVGKMVIIR